MLRLKLRTQAIILTLVITTSAALSYGVMALKGDAPDLPLVTAAAAEDMDGWDLLSLAEVREEGGDEDWRAVKTFPLELRAAADGFTIEGFVVPIIAQGYIEQFLMVEAPENCPFCGNGESYGPVLEVNTRRPIPDMPEFSEVIVRGTLEFNEDTDTFQMFRLMDAELLEVREVDLDLTLPPGMQDSSTLGIGE